MAGIQLPEEGAVKCPITGEEVFPNLAELKELGTHILACPSCGKMHRWLALASKLVEIVDPDKGPADGEEK